MATPAQKRKWLIVGLMMALGLLVGMIGLIRADDMSNLKAAIVCGLGFGSFLASFALLIK